MGGAPVFTTWVAVDCNMSLKSQDIVGSCGMLVRLPLGSYVYVSLVVPTVVDVRRLLAGGAGLVIGVSAGQLPTAALWVRDWKLPTAS